MVSLESLKNLIHKKALSQTDRLLLILAAGSGPQKTQALVAVGKAAGIRRIKEWNIAARLNASAGKAINTPSGWELTREGRKYVTDELGAVSDETPGSGVASDVRKQLAKISSAKVRAFVEEAVECLERSNRRAAVVLSWVGALAVLQEHVVATKLPEFNAEAARRNAKYKPAKTADDFSRMDEYEFLQICGAISVVVFNVKQRLEQALKLRNAAGHPNSLEIGELDAAAHVETLAKNVFEKF